MRIATIPTVFLLLICLIGCGTRPPIPVVDEGDGVTASNYILGPGDNLSISVYHNPDLSMTLPVRPDGRVSMPLVTDMAAAGKTPTQLAQDLQAKLKEFVKEPTVTVVVMGFVGPFARQVRVIGEATQPMAFPYSDHMTLLDVMIEAKGLTRFAAGNSAQIVRHSGDKTVTIPVHLGDLIRDGDITQNVAMQPGDTLIIPQTWF